MTNSLMTLSVDDYGKYAMYGILYFRCTKEHLNITNRRDFERNISVIMEAIPVENVVLDLTDVIFLDSSVLGALLHVLYVVRRDGKEMYIINLSEQAKKTLIMTRCDNLFNYINSVEEIYAQQNIEN